MLSALLLLVTYGIVTVWNAAFFNALLVSRIFKKTKEKGLAKIILGWTSFAKGFNKTDYMIKAKGLKRV